MKLFLFKAGRFLILLGTIWGLEMAGRKRDHVFPTARSSAGGLCGICADKQRVLTRGCSSPHGPGGRRLLPCTIKPGFALLAVLSGLLRFVGVALQFSSIPALAPCPGPGSMGYCLSHPGMCRQARTSGSLQSNTFCSEQGGDCGWQLRRLLQVLRVCSRVGNVLSLKHG